MAKREAAGPVDGPWALPDDWRWKRLPQVAAICDHLRRPINNTERLKRNEGKTPGELYPYYGATGQAGVIDGYLADGEYILLGEDGAPFLDPFKAKAYAVSGRFWVNNHAHVLMGNPHLDVRLLLHWLNTIKYDPFVNGTTRLKLTQGAMMEMPVPVPPADVQSRLVSCIDELFAEIDDGEAALVRARDDLGTWRKALLKAAVTGELTADWRAANPSKQNGDNLLARVLADRRALWESHTRKRGKRYQEPEQPDLNLFRHIPALPSGWVWASIAQLTSLVTSGSRGWADYYSDAGATFIRAQNINTDRLCLEGVAYVSPPNGGEGTRTKVSKGDLLITITGANVTKSALVDVGVEEAYVSQHVALVRPVYERLAAFLYWWIVTPAGGRAILERLAYGAGKPGLNLPNLLGLPVPLPPLDEQREITRLCSSVDEERSSSVGVTREGQYAAATLRQSILTAAFRGELA